MPRINFHLAEALNFGPELSYQVTQLALLAPACALLAKHSTLSRYIPSITTTADPSSWGEKLLETWLPGSGTSSSISSSPLISGWQTIMIAAAIGALTAITFQCARRAPILRRAPVTTFILSGALSCAGSSFLPHVPVESVAEIAKNIFFVGTGLTATAKVLNFVRDKLGPVLNFLDLLGPVQPYRPLQKTPDQTAEPKAAPKAVSPPPAPAAVLPPPALEATLPPPALEVTLPPPTPKISEQPPPKKDDLTSDRPAEQPLPVASPPASAPPSPRESISVIQRRKTPSPPTPPSSPKKPVGLSFGSSTPPPSPQKPSQKPTSGLSRWG